MQTTIKQEPEALKAKHTYKLAEGVPDTTYNLIMATQELGGAVVEAEGKKMNFPKRQAIIIQRRPPSSSVMLLT